MTSAATIFASLAPAALTGDLAAKQRMLEASSAANMATGTSLPGLAHVLSQPLGRYHIAHGLGTGIVLPYTMEFNLPVAAGKLAPIARLLGYSGSDRECAEDLLDRLWELMVEVGLTALDPEVVREDDLPLLVEQCTQVVNYRLNVRSASPADLTKLYRRALGRSDGMTSDQSVGGFWGKVLFVDVGTGETREEALDPRGSSRLRRRPRPRRLLPVQAAGAGHRSPGAREPADLRPRPAQQARPRPAPPARPW